MRKLTGVALIVALISTISTPAFAAQQSASPAAEAAAFRQMASGIPLGTRVRLETTSGRRLTATLMNVTEDTIVVKREARVPEPALAIRFDELSTLKRHEPRGFGLAKALGVGVAAGAGAILTIFAIAVSLDD